MQHKRGQHLIMPKSVLCCDKITSKDN